MIESNNQECTIGTLKLFKKKKKGVKNSLKTYVTTVY